MLFLKDFLEESFEEKDEQGTTLMDKHMDTAFGKHLPQFENQIMAWVHVRSITSSTMYQKAPFC